MRCNGGLWLIGEMQLDNSGWTWHGLGMDFTKLGPLFTCVGISLVSGGVVAVPKTAPAWVQGALVVIGVVMVAAGQYLSHQTTKTVLATQDVHEDAINILIGADAKPASPASSSPPAGSLVGAIQSTASVPTIKTP